MSKKRASNADLAKEAKFWETESIPEGWESSPEAIPMVGASTPISIRMPTQFLSLLKKMAEKQGVDCQVLIKRWLDDRLREELKILKGKARSKPSNVVNVSKQPSKRTKSK